MNLKTEPAVIIGGITAFVTAAIAALVAFGLGVSDEQRNAILGMIAPTVGLILLVSALIRSRVYSPETTQEIADKAAATHVADISAPPSGNV